jgi:hypothetical protein
MATNPGTTIAATMLRARSGVIAHFIDAGAISSDKALTYQPQRHAERRALSYLMGEEVVRMTQEGRYWVDEEAARAWRRENGVRTAWMVGGALVAVGALVAWRRYRGRQD